MSGKEALERKLRALEHLRSEPDSPARREQLRKALKDRSNYFVSKAAALAGDLRLQDLEPDLLAAFNRFMVNPVKSDPQCWAKNAIAKALKDLGHQDAAIFLRGLAHFQPEPVWGGSEDTATALRGTCALALPGCALDDLEVLRHLVEALADPAKPVRIDAARAIAQLPRPESALLLRLKALVGDSDAEVKGQCFASLLSIEPRAAVPFVARFLDSDTDSAVEAAAALGESHEPEALESLKRCWSTRKEPQIRRAVLFSLGASPQQAAVEFLLSVLDEASGEVAADAVTALAASRFRSEVRERLAAIVAGKRDAKLRQVFEKEFRSP